MARPVARRDLAAAITACGEEQRRRSEIALSDAQRDAGTRAVVLPHQNLHEQGQRLQPWVIAGTALLLISIAMFAIQFKASSMFTLPADLFPAREVGTVWGVYGAVGSFGGAAFGALTGWTIENYSWTPVFVMAACMHILSAIIVSFFIPKIQLLEPLSPRDE